MDKRYTIKYNTSLTGNLECIKKDGLDAFMESENSKWLCGTCGGTLCVHRNYCLNCENGSSKK